MQEYSNIREYGQDMLENGFKTMVDLCAEKKPSELIGKDLLTMLMAAESISSAIICSLSEDSTYKELTPTQVDVIEREVRDNQIARGLALKLIAVNRKELS